MIFSEVIKLYSFKSLGLFVCLWIVEHNDSSILWMRKKNFSLVLVKVYLYEISWLSSFLALFVNQECLEQMEIILYQVGLFETVFNLLYWHPSIPTICLKVYND